MEHSNDILDIHKSIKDYNPDKKRKLLIVLIVFDDVIADMINNEKLNSIVTELFIRDRKSNISIVFITQSYFKVQHFSKLLYIICQILALKILRKIIKTIFIFSY